MPRSSSDQSSVSVIAAALSPSWDHLVARLRPTMSSPLFAPVVALLLRAAQS